MSLNAILRYLNFETSCGVLVFTFSNHWHEFLERHNTQVFLGLNFVAAWLHAAENRSRARWWRCSEDASSSKSAQNGDDPADSSVDTLVNSAVTVYPIHIDCEEEWWKHNPFRSSHTHDEGLWFNAADTDTNFLAGIRWRDGQYQAVVNTVLLQHSHSPSRRTRFFEFKETSLDIFRLLPKFLKHLLVCSATSRGILQHRFNYVFLQGTWNIIFQESQGKKCLGIYYVSFCPPSFFRPHTNSNDVL